MKKEKMKSKNKLLIFTNLFLIFILMVVGVYAWFAAQSDNRADAYDIQVFADNPLEISLDGVSWGSNIDLNSFIKENNFEFKEVTGDGSPDKMWVPTLEQRTNPDNGLQYAVPNINTDWRKAEPNKDYLELKIMMRSLDKLRVYLGSDSFAEPVSTVLTGTDAGNPSSYATGANKFSKDCIVGALRVGYQSTHEESTNDGRYVWIPRSDIHLNNTVGSSVYSVTVSDTVTYEHGNTWFNHWLPYRWNMPTVHYYYSVGDTGYKNIVNMTNTLTKKLPDTVNTIENEFSEIAFLDENVWVYDGMYYYAEATIAIWIEGCDTEARRALSGGKFNLTLTLDSFSAS